MCDSPRMAATWFLQSTALSDAWPPTPLQLLPLFETVASTQKQQ